jgi:hypothetical protein
LGRLEHEHFVYICGLAAWVGSIVFVVVLGVLQKNLTMRLSRVGFGWHLRLCSLLKSSLYTQFDGFCANTLENRPVLLHIRPAIAFGINTLSL